MAMYGIHRVEKRQSSDVGSLQAEANRSADNPKNFDASDIDWSKTPDNHFFVKSDSWLKDIRTKISAVGASARKNSVVMLDGFYGASPEFFKDKSRDEILKYFEECLEFHKRNYGIVINAVVHLDEETPHMQVCSVPLTVDGRLCAKEICGRRQDYTRRQDAFYEEVTKAYGLDRGEIKETAKVKREHLSVQDYKLAKNAERLSAQKQTLTKNADTIIELKEFKRASHTLKMPHIRPQTFGDGVIVESDVKTVENAFKALQLAQNMAKDKKASMRTAKDVIDKANHKAESIVQNAQDRYADIRLAEIQLDKIKSEHPELFTKSGQYISQNKTLNVVPKNFGRIDR